MVNITFKPAISKRRMITIVDSHDDDWAGGQKVELLHITICKGKHCIHIVPSPNVIYLQGRLSPLRQRLIRAGYKKTGENK